MEFLLAGFELGFTLAFLICGVLLGLGVAIALIALVIKYWIIAICALLALGALAILPYF